MGAAAPRFMWLLSSPFPLLRRHHHRNLFLLSSHFHRLSSSSSSTSPSPLLSSSSPLKLKLKLKLSQHQNQRFQTVASSSSSSSLCYDTFSSPIPHPWPEWSHFLSNISSAVYLRRPPPPPADVGDFASPSDLPPQFLSDAAASLAFARERPNLLRLLPRRDVVVVVEHGFPFLFQDAEDSVAKMKSFVSNADATVLDTDKATMVDLMKFMLSYASNPLVSSESNTLYNRDLVESSVRNLFGELCKLSYNAPGPNSTMPRGKKNEVEMRRGDWICTRCDFMNFGRNVKCRECEEARPKRQLVGGEWECPQCDFFNYGKNMTCLRCDCKRPGQISSGPTDTVSTMGYRNGDNNNNTSDVDSRLAANEEKAQRWFSKVSQLDNSADINSLAADEDFPEIMPLRKGVNRFVVSTRKTPLERRLADAQYKRKLDNNDTPGVQDFKSENLITEESETDVRYASSGDNSQLSSNPAGQNVIVDKEKEQAEKSERWFRKVAELHDVSDLSSAISDEDFPEIMPMRKGENRFVVSKKKDRSLTSPAYKRRLTMEQSGHTNFVPFVPFPPDYFAKDKQPADGTDSADRSKVESSSIPEAAEKPPEMSDDARARTEFPGANYSQGMTNAESFSMVPGNPPKMLDDARLGPERRENVKEIASPKPSQQSSSNYATGSIYGATTSGNSSQRLNQEDSGNKYSRKENKDQMPNLPASSSPASESQRVGAQWTGKSLEGSAVKEPDPLDMSEEAKAERWFRRVAQIKDISELSQIPDEDFPSIMPMRKGVNRFVVSKRKTPLERRLTSQQYRRNLPIVSSDPVKNENEGS